MNINEKFDFLLKLAKISNTEIGKAVLFDASYISRMRTGKRKVPMDMEFLERFSKIIAQNINNDYQLQILQDIINCNVTTKEDMEEKIFRWIFDTSPLEDSPIFELLHKIATPQDPMMMSVSDMPNFMDMPNLSDMNCFYGDDGKRQAVLLFLSKICNIKNPPELLLFSSEKFNWIYDDEEFAKKWAMLLLIYAKNGGHIKIIHTIERDLNEMIKALNKWIPLYMSRFIEPFYYPNNFDMTFRRTIFIAKNHSVVFSNSINKNTEKNSKFSLL